VIVKVTELAPPATATEAGTVATPGLLLVRVTTAPPANALALSVTVPVDMALPTTAGGLSVNVLMANGLTVNVA
jgi:hypothetical protein